jgi:hypothetical protein
MTSPVGRNDPCPCGSGQKYKRCCLEADRTRATTTSGHGDFALTLVVETPNGPMIRRVPAASPLPGEASQGYAAEVATHDAAAVWGMPDFVFRPKTETAGRGNRELGDGFLIVGDVGVVLQVKSRSLEAVTDEPDRERGWIEKKSSDALRQARGTIRRMTAGGVTELKNLRGRSVPIDPAAHTWISVAVIDHPQPPDEIRPDLGGDEHAVVLLRQDWEFLFDQLKSTHAVAQYLRRVSGEAIDLGSESSRYYQLALDDANAQPEVLPAELIGPGRTVSVPVLPLAPAAGDDFAEHQLIRAIYEEFALAPLTSSAETDRLRTLAELDRVAVGERANVGQFLMTAMKEASEEAKENDSPGTWWSLRSIRSSAGGAHLGYGACSRPYDEEISKGFGLWVRLRHYDLVSVTGDADERTTVAVLLTPSRHASRPWDTTVVAVTGDMGFTDEDLVVLRELWPTPATASAH